MLRFISSAASFSTKHSSVSHEKKENPIKDLRHDQRLDKNSFPKDSTTRTRKGLVSCEFVSSVDFANDSNVIDYIV